MTVQGQTGTITGAEINNIYSYIRDLMGSGARVFRYTVATYAAGSPARTLTFAANSVTWQLNGQPQTFDLPDMVFIGYTKQEERLITDWYNAMVDRIKAGDQAFINSGGMQQLLDNTGPGGRTIYSL